MGWSTVYNTVKASERKSYLDNYVFVWTRDAESTSTTKVIKSAMVGSTYYAAVETLHDDGRKEVWAIICLTDLENNEFSYKSMSEGAGPRESRCPAGILNLLTDTDDEYALKWRKRCRENLKKPKSLEIGAQLELGENLTPNGIAIIVNKIKSSYVLDFGAEGRFTMSSAMLNKYLKSGSIKQI